jgi:chromosome partitioning protein
VTKTICFANNKGGSGKSTACANLGYALAKAGKKILLLDGDMQLNLSLSFFEEEEVLSLASEEKNLYEALRKQSDLTECVIPTRYENIDLVRSTMLMSQIEYELFTKMQRELVLKKCLKQLKEAGKYDYILIDAPPTLGTWVINILCASDYCIIPVEASPWGLFGLANMFDFLKGLDEMTEAEVMGVLITKVDERKNYYRQTTEILKDYDNIRLFNTVIHVDSAVEWAQDRSLPVAEFKRSARSAKEFAELAEEVKSYGSRKRKHGKSK